MVKSWHESRIAPTQMRLRFLMRTRFPVCARPWKPSNSRRAGHKAVPLDAPAFTSSLVADYLDMPLRKRRAMRPCGAGRHPDCRESVGGLVGAG